MDTTLTTYEKCILFAVIGNMVILKNLKDVIQEGLRSNSKVASKYKIGSVRNNNGEL